jgi:ATP synthase protein I
MTASVPAPIDAVPGSQPVEKELAFHMAKLALPVAVVVISLAAVIRGANGAWSALLAVAIVVVNMIVAAAMLTWAARISANMLMSVALLGFLLRMLIITAVVWGVKDQPWVDLKTLAVAILATQLAVLAWECRYVASSMNLPPASEAPTSDVKETLAP